MGPIAAAAPASSRAPRDGLSHVVGATEPPLVDRTIGECLDATVARHGERTACVFPEQGVRWTWLQLQSRADRLAGGLLHLGLRTGDRLGIWSPNRSEWLLVQYATARIGVVLVNINPAYRTSELEYALGTVQCKAVVAAPGHKGADYLAMLREVRPTLPGLEWVIELGAGAAADTLRFDDVVAAASADDIAEARRVGGTLGCHDAVNIQFTSGTTGQPKGATLTHRNIVNNARFVAAAMGFTAGDVLCVPVPLYHCFGMVMASLACAASGGTMVFPGEGFDALATLHALHDERCTALYGVATMFIAQLDHPRFGEFDLRSLRTGIMAGGPCPVVLMERVVAQMHLRDITIAYGMTETSPVSFQSDVDDPLPRRVATVGRVQPHLEVKIVDDAGRTVPVGATGELLTRGYSVMQGYWGDDARTAQAVVDGWMHTGDLATLDADGYCNIVGRVKDMLIRGGENVYPREIEEYLYTHPAVAQAQVFGVPDAKYGEAVCAWVVLKPGAQATSEADIQAYCSGRIAHYKVPKHVRLVPELPMTVTGKAQKFVMRAAMIRELGLVEQRTA